MSSPVCSRLCVCRTECECALLWLSQKPCFHDWRCASVPLQCSSLLYWSPVPLFVYSCSCSAFCVLFCFFLALQCLDSLPAALIFLPDPCVNCSGQMLRLPDPGAVAAGAGPPASESKARGGSGPGKGKGKSNARVQTRAVAKAQARAAALAVTVSVRVARQTSQPAPLP